MKIVIISDTHGKHKDLEKWLPKEADAIICAGDISKFGDMGSINSFLYWFSNLHQFKTKIFIAGNHDKYFEDQHNLAIGIIPSNIIYLENQEYNLNGIKIYGSPVTPWFHNWAFNVQRGEAIKKYWNMIPEDTDILVTHGPPFGVLDVSFFSPHGNPTDEPNHAGCEELIIAVNKIKPKVHVFGHIHPHYGTLKENETLFINASNADSKYEMKNKPILIEVNEKTKEAKLLSW